MLNIGDAKDQRVIAAITCPLALPYIAISSRRYITSEPTMTSFAITVPDMACGACADTITRAVKEIDPAAAVDPNLDSKVVKISSAVHQETLTKAIKKAGYTVEM
jgi:copper chaperone